MRARTGPPGPRAPGPTAEQREGLVDDVLGAALAVRRPPRERRARRRCEGVCADPRREVVDRSAVPLGHEPLDHPGEGRGRGLPTALEGGVRADDPQAVAGDLDRVVRERGTDPVRGAERDPRGLGRGPEAELVGEAHRELVEAAPHERGLAREEPEQRAAADPGGRRDVVHRDGVEALLVEEPQGHERHRSGVDRPRASGRPVARRAHGFLSALSATTVVAQGAPLSEETT